MVPTGKVCEVINCSGIVVAQGLCAKHYKRLQRHEDPLHRKNAGGGDTGAASKHPLYATWRNCTRTLRGTCMCERWKIFENFAEDVGERPTEHSYFRRIDSEKLFEPGNVIWLELQNGEEYRNDRAAYMRKYSKRMRDVNPDYFRNLSYIKTYGVTLEWFNSEFEKQNGVCCICRQPESAVVKGKPLNLSVDHCHDTGQVRGLLCKKCNTGIGNLKHDVQLLHNAVKYLERNQNGTN